MGKTIKTKYYDTYCIVNGDNKIIISEFYNYYITQNHRKSEVVSHFGIGNRSIGNIMNTYNLPKKSNELIHKLNKITCKDKYGDENYNNQNQTRETCLKKYGVDNQFKRVDYIRESHIKSFGTAAPIQNPDIANKIRSTWDNKTQEEIKNIREKTYKTNLKRYGVKTPMENPEIAKKNSLVPGKYEKAWETRKLNKTTNTSKPEEEFNLFLVNLFGKEKIKRNYKSKLYPYHCDFYIEDLNIYIELNLYWTHMKHPFTGSEEDLIDLEKLKTKATGKNQYNTAIQVWTISDVNKIRLAKENNLNYLYAYNDDDIKKMKEDLYEIKSSLKYKNQG